MFLPGARPFRGRTVYPGEWDTLVTGSPALVSSLVSFDCRISDARIVATHHVIIGEIVGIRLGEPNAALVYQGRHYREL